MQIFVTTETGKTITLDVNEEYTTNNVKWLIQGQQGMPAGVQRLIFDGKQLDDADTLGHSNVVALSRLDLLMGLQGGAKAVKVGRSKVSKDGKIREFMDGLRANRAQANQTGVADPTIVAVHRNLDVFVNAVNTQENVIKHALGLLTLPQLKKVYNSLSSGNQEHKVNTCMREIFSTELNNLGTRKSEIAAMEAALAHAVLAAFCGSYMSEDGSYDMKGFGTDVLTVICSKQPGAAPASPAAPAGAADVLM
jgi:ubiquitin-like protein Nedd8